MKWQFVFNGSLKYHGHIDKVCEAAKNAGYKFFSFNGEIYDLHKEMTGITIFDCI